MTPTTPSPARSITLPLRVLALVLVLVFGVEMGIMFLLPWWTHWTGWAVNGAAAAFTDALVLAAALCPALWFVVVRPLRDLSEQRARLIARIIQVQEDERARISRDLHDEFGQLLTTVLVGLRTIEGSSDLSQARERAHGIRDITAAGIESVKRIAQGLRAPLLEDLGLGPALERLCDETAATHGLEVTARIELAPGTRFSAHVELGVYRLVQEALTNVVRHAEAAEASVNLRLVYGALEVRVADNGKGMRIQAGPARGLGLQGMRERVLLLGGTMSIHSTPGSGTTILIRLPLSEAPNDSNSRPHRG